MKKLWLLVWLLCMGVWASDFPQSILLESGDVKIRLDGTKALTPNRVEYQGQLIGIDNPYSHYGTVFFIAGTKGFVGSGHTETGFREEVKSATLQIDGKEVDYRREQRFSGNEIKFTKVSAIRDFTVTYELEIGANRICERTEITSATDVDLLYMYHFMHPWTPDFTDLFYRNADGSEHSFEFKSDEKNPVYHPVPAAAWYNRKNGIGLATVVQPGSGQLAPTRFVWDRPGYRKDYLVDYVNSRFPAGKKAVYAVKTAFFQQPDAAKWTNNAKAAFEQLKPAP